MDLRWELVECPAAGRQVTRARRVRLSDVTASGRVRLDALARYLQDVAADDVAEVGIGGLWVLRRAVLEVQSLPSYGDEVELTTFCSALGPHLAERRTTIRAGGVVAVETAAVWVYVNEAGRPTAVEPRFTDLYAPSMNGRRTTGRLRHRPPPAGIAGKGWALRSADLDVLGHVNNAVSWAAVEDALAETAPGRGIAVAEIEYRAPIDRDEHPVLGQVLGRGPGGERLSCWLTVDAAVRTSAVIALR